MALSYARPDPSSPTAVASASFGTVRRGYDPGEVRDYLQQVAAELARLQERERELERELAAARRAPAPQIDELDEATVTNLLGEETARVLSTAREAATQIRARAEEGSARLFREAQDDASRLREQAELESARRRQEATRDAEAELEAARQQGRDMVAEAREYREKVLADLAKRREMARQQLADLQSGRERLLQAFERARIVAVDVQGELSQLGDEPDELVNLAVTTGPVPITVPRHEVPLATRPAPAAPAAPMVAPEPEPEPEVSVAEVEAESEVVEEALDETVEVVDESTVEVVEEAAGEDVAAEEPEPAEPLAPVVSLFAGELPAEPVGRTEKPSVDDLFAKLRAAKVDEIARDVEGAEPLTVAAAAAAAVELDDEADAETDTEEAESPFVVRDEALAPIELNLARKFKRALADEQNDLLDVLRRKEPVRSIDEVLPALAEHSAPYLDAAREELPAAARAGARSTSSDDADRLDRRLADAGVVTRTVDELGAQIIEPLREQLDHAIAEAAGDNGVIAAAVRSMYREWKTRRLDELAAELTRSAYATGAYAVIVPGTPVRWVSEPGWNGCAEATANEAAGLLSAGDTFPSGHPCPPAAIGCRCLLVTTSGSA